MPAGGVVQEPPGSHSGGSRRLPLIRMKSSGKPLWREESVNYADWEAERPLSVERSALSVNCMSGSAWMKNKDWVG